MGSAARALVDRHEQRQSVADRRRLGSHTTPADLARVLVDAGFDELGRTPGRVLDPACGAGSFLLAAADALAARGIPAGEVVERRIVGLDVDPVAVATAREVLARWADERGAGPVTPCVAVADPLGVRPQVGPVDLVVGNPPFLAQLTADTARGAAERAVVRTRFGDLGPYTDSSALFLLCAVDLVEDGGVVVMLQPQSVLASRDAGAVRRRVGRDAPLVGMWASEARHFAADVDVCAPVLRRGSDAGPVRLRWGTEGAVLGTVRLTGPGGSGGPLLARCLDVPEVPDPAPSAPLVGDVATSTAGFRDEFYALADAAREPGERGWSTHGPRLVTVGMIDPGRLSWGVAPRRLRGRSVSAPRLDRHALREASPRVAAWAAHRLRPKALVATQTRVVEAPVDAAGDCVPVTPTIAVEPLAEDVRGRPAPDVWALAAALLAPPVAARVVATASGSGLAVGSIRWSARAVREVPLPTDRRAWSRGTDLGQGLRACPAAEVPALLERLARLMSGANGLPDDHPAASWWLERAVRA